MRPIFKLWLLGKLQKQFESIQLHLFQLIRFKLIIFTLLTLVMLCFFTCFNGVFCNIFLFHCVLYFPDPTVISANYSRIIRQGDFKAILGKSVPIPSMDTEEKITDEFIEVEYSLKDGKMVKEMFLQPVPHEHLLKRTAQREPGIPLNILIVGIDSLSHANTKRKLPKAYKYLKDELGSIMFNGHSIVGDGTTEQLTAMLTGLGELEQYESRRHHKNPKPVDGWAWIYKQLKGK